jgi:hypothetical protein
MGHVVTALKRSVSLLVLAIAASAAGGGLALAKAAFENPKLKTPVVIEQPHRSTTAVALTSPATYAR